MNPDRLSTGELDLSWGSVLAPEPSFFTSHCTDLFDTSQGLDCGLTCINESNSSVDLQVVPSSDDVFDPISLQNDEEYNGLQHVTTMGCSSFVEESLPSAPSESCGNILENINTEEKRLRTNSDDVEHKVHERDSSKRKESDSDSLDVYLKPCVITPTKLEDLYSTLGEDSSVFQFQQDIHQAYQGDEGSSQVFVPNLLSEFTNFDSVNNNSGIDANSEEMSYLSNDMAVEESHACRRQHSKMADELDHTDSLRNDGQLYTSMNEQNTLVLDPSSTNVFLSYEPAPFQAQAQSANLCFPPFSSCVFPPKATRVNLPRFCVDLQNNILNESRIEKVVFGEKIFEEERDSRCRENENYKDSYEVISKANRSSETAQVSSNQTHDREKQSETTAKKSSELNQREQVEDTGGKDFLRDLRVYHNGTEKQRREQMKSRFDNLRKVIPKIQRIDKCPKIQILKQARKYIRVLENEGEHLEMLKSREKDKNKKLLERLQTIVGM